MQIRFLKCAGIVFLFLMLTFLFSDAGIISAAQKVPINFDDYHGYTGTVNYIKAVAKAYPNITKLVEIGKSTMGRPIYVLVVSNRKNGTTIDAHVNLRNKRKEGVKNVTPQKPYQGKPGFWLCGSTHGNEYTGTEVCLYTIDKLVSGYGADEEITRIVNDQTFYICPAVNPDGLYNSIEKGISQRQNTMKKDDDGDGKVNEDGPDDLNGDGYITRFRYKDPKGLYVMDDEDPRLMIRLRRGEKTAKERYSVIREDKDNDGDGKRGEDSDTGIDLNRNFPEGWFKKDMAGGKGDYPTSAPETHAIAEFFTNHTNILMAQNYHTSGGFTYRPMGTAPHPELHPKDVAVLDMIMGKKYLEIIGEEVPEAWEDPDKLSEFKAELEKTSKNKYAKARGYVLPRGWRVSYNEEKDVPYNYGMATDWMYKQLGIYALTTELWNPMKDIQDFPQFAGEDARIKAQRALLKYQDEKFGGKLFLPWKTYNHPELGEGEIGGWISKYRSNALPGAPLINVCEKHWQFEKFRAGLQPDIVITEAKAKVITESSGSGADARRVGDQVTIEKVRSKAKFKIVEVTATIENKGKLATHVARGAQLAGNREDIVWLIGDRDRVAYLQGSPFQKLGTIEGAMKIPGYSGRGAQPPQQERRRMMFYYPGFPMMFMRGPRYGPTEVKQKGPKRTVKWLVAVEGDAPLKIVVTSQKGGTKVKNLRIQ
ncbi:MAG: M14 family metallopeptidase [Candidatus Aminicenantes bacterium]